VLSRMDIDWICYDLQHGLMDYSDLLRLLPAICGLPVTPLVRVAANQPDQIGRVLDAGAQGVIVPMVNTPEDARVAAQACRYPPAGNRSCGPMRDVLISGMQYLQRANNEMACIAMIETAEGLANVDEIAAVEGVDALFVGPIDLCFGLGIAPGNFDDPAFRSAIERILTATQANGIAAGMFGYSPELAREALDTGFVFASAGTDISFFRNGVDAALKTVRSKQGLNLDSLY